MLQPAGRAESRDAPAAESVYLCPELRPTLGPPPRGAPPKACPGARHPTPRDCETPPSSHVGCWGRGAGGQEQPSPQPPQSHGASPGVGHGGVRGPRSSLGPLSCLSFHLCVIRIRFCSSGVLLAQPPPSHDARPGVGHGGTLGLPGTFFMPSLSSLCFPIQFLPLRCAMVPAPPQP